MQCLHLLFSPIAKSGLALVIRCDLLRLQTRCWEANRRYLSPTTALESPNSIFSTPTPKIQQVKKQITEAWFWAAASDRWSFPEQHRHFSSSTIYRPRRAGAAARSLGSAGGARGGGNKPFPLPAGLLFNTDLRVHDGWWPKFILYSKDGGILLRLAYDEETLASPADCSSRIWRRCRIRLKTLL